MKENNTSRNNGSTALVKQIRNTLEDMGRLTDDARKSETIQKYLEFSARFHNYSFSNQILIFDVSQTMGKPVPGPDIKTCSCFAYHLRHLEFSVTEKQCVPVRGMLG